ncbi:hypothetical protein WALSEDRAFT_67028 [Wallemia mellicola CBS 633.66]|uniref:Uncharacterized protein n=2 Tax=Wallemia mellicola TaxID=1708541 RepID=A0A4T0R9B8_9BASI|nr:hypothetical protein WALSEDRAFT_67028 [Wallemia mellicola CBS 633.66]TIB79462.1 hypothetical protein E3Q23_00113 [Wallemia mellicola]EIM24181.1 hypothetical protein WALSEDRAFT_67028 [Wallemia mellicola CBS 633.66]TIB89465.1 hypothetical protein E3Q21_00566 [Wallemia mellicola]TIB91856.1 hypothetical protein E3Q20_00552 [Wallemia mellicola]TIB94800.1 hypothetical protein E3Q19_00153 [Wallemia mellicola]|eukprot:XP_006956002.1 hypothetical protein WALSEDRAFT_67028 [Wallemia mellicola CBS 633.66]
MSANLGYLKSQLSNRRSGIGTSDNKKTSSKKDDFIKANKIYAHQHEIEKQQRMDRMSKRRGDDSRLTEAQDEARKQKMKEGIDRYNALRSNQAKPTNEEKELLQFDGNYTSDSSEYDSEVDALDELTEGEDEWGRTVMISRREKEMLDPLSKRTHRVKGEAIYGDKLKGDWHVYEQTEEERERFKAHYSDKGYIRDPTKEKDQRHRGALYYKFGDSSVKQQQIDELKALHDETMNKRNQGVYSYREARKKLVKEYDPNGMLDTTQTDNFIEEAINTSG